MNNPIFITGIGTDVGKTLIAAIVTEALNADYWKPIQAGYLDGTDAELVSSLISHPVSKIHPELYRLQTPASPHIAARKEDININTDLVAAEATVIINTTQNRPLIIEGAGGLLVPLGDEVMVADLAKKLQAKIILVSRNYLGSINHSLLTAAYCKSQGLNVAGWIFSDDYMHYEEEIVNWSGYPSIASIPKLQQVDKATIKEQADRIRVSLQEHLL